LKLKNQYERTMKINFEVSAEIAASPQQIYEAWLDSDKHSAMTGGQAIVSDIVGDSFTAWDGYIEGKNLELEAGAKIIQQWRTSEFDNSDDDSHLEVVFKVQGESTLVTIRHSRDQSRFISQIPLTNV